MLIDALRDRLKGHTPLRRSRFDVMYRDDEISEAMVPEFLPAGIDYVHDLPMGKRVIPAVTAGLGGAAGYHLGSALRVGSRPARVVGALAGLLGGGAGGIGITDSVPNRGRIVRAYGVPAYAAPTIIDVAEGDLHPSVLDGAYDIVARNFRREP